jgi:hypothetical protein
MSIISNGLGEREKATKGYFAVDVHCLRYACQIGLNAAVSYLVLASGTGGDNTTTSWSTNSIENYTSISRGRAKDAIQQLVKSRLIQQLKSGTMPQYRLPRWEELRAMPSSENLSDRLRLVLEVIKTGTDLDPKQKAAAGELVRRRLVDRVGSQFVIVPPQAPDLAFIPNAFVCGAAREVPPLERLRQTQDAMALRLAVVALGTCSISLGLSVRPNGRTPGRTAGGQPGSRRSFIQ